MINMMISVVCMFVLMMLLGGMLPAMSAHCMFALGGICFHFFNKLVTEPMIRPMLSKLLP